jgi:pimeloyl-ACP methyl ester carboxylesterase
MVVPEQFDLEDFAHHYHYFEQFEGSFALLSSLETVQTAIVFVHGFGGDAVGTWNEFHMMVDDTDWTSYFSESDLFFFQYSSVWERIQSSTDRLLGFLDRVIFQPDMSNFTASIDALRADDTVRPGQVPVEPLNTISALPAERRYRQVFLVGHSEGGVVIRNGIKDKLNGNSPILKSQLVLFAPAIGGYAPAGFLGILANWPFLGTILDAVLQAAPAYQDLRDNDLLKEIRRKTERKDREAAKAKDKSRPALSAYIVWGRKDRVVKPMKYDQDNENFEDCNHIDVCKPSSSYFSPLVRLSERVRQK